MRSHCGKSHGSNTHSSAEAIPRLKSDSTSSTDILNSVAKLQTIPVYTIADSQYTLALCLRFALLFLQGKRKQDLAGPSQTPAQYSLVQDPF